MKKSICIALLFVLSINSFAQKKENKIDRIDAFARNTGYYPLPELARKLTAPYKDEASKVRSIFVWVATHISYDVQQYKNPVGHDQAELKKLVDSLHVVKDQYWHYVWGLEALQNKKAVCAGYAALFKILCEEACLRAAVINGAARKPNDIGRVTKSNHAWNAVMIGEEWKLLDVTWASGAVTNTDQFVQKFNEYYYCVSPERMIFDHYPDVFAWALLPKPVSKIWYDRNPYIFSGADPELVPSRYLPAQGMLTVKRNDTLSFELDVNGPVYSITLTDEQTNVSSWLYPDPANKDRESLKKRNIGSTTAVKNAKHQAKSTSDKVSKPGSRSITISAAKGNTERDINAVIADQLNEHSLSSDLKRFVSDGKTVKFKYVVKRGGMFNLSIFINWGHVMEYTVFVR